MSEIKNEIFGGAGSGSSLKPDLPLYIEVADQTARLALTEDEVELGTMVRQVDNDVIYTVVDITQLGTENAFSIIGYTGPDADTQEVTILGGQSLVLTPPVWATTILVSVLHYVRTITIEIPINVVTTALYGGTMLTESKSNLYYCELGWDSATKTLTCTDIGYRNSSSGVIFTRLNNSNYKITHILYKK